VECELEAEIKRELPVANSSGRNTDKELTPNGPSAGTGQQRTQMLNERG